MGERTAPAAWKSGAYNYSWKQKWPWS